MISITFYTFLVVNPPPARAQMWVSSKLVTQERDSESFTKRCTVSLRVEGIAGKDAGGRVAIGGTSHNRTRTLQCDAHSCASFIVMHLGVLEYPRYLINISFAGLESVDRHFNIVDIIFTVITYNPEFTKMELWFRLFFVATTAVIAIVFLVGGMKNFVNLDEWAIEQKWVALLLPLLLAFDDPLFPMTLTSSNLFAAVCDAVFQVGAGKDRSLRRATFKCQFPCSRFRPLFSSPCCSSGSAFFTDFDRPSGASTDFMSQSYCWLAPCGCPP